MAGDTGRRGGPEGAQQDLGAAGAQRGRSDAGRPRPLGTQVAQLGVQACTTTTGVDVGGGEVVVATSDPQPQGEAAAAEPVERRNLAAQQRGGAQRREQDLGLQPDPGRRPGKDGEGDERLGVVPDQAVEQAERGERAGVGAGGPVVQDGRVVDGQTDSDRHREELLRAGGFRTARSWRGSRRRPSAASFSRNHLSESSTTPARPAASRHRFPAHPRGLAASPVEARPWSGQRQPGVDICFASTHS
ncbi:hypothetical protein GCM10023403_09130 [Pseudonocardia benzenivorans]